LKVSLIYNETIIDPNYVNNVFGMTTKEHFFKDRLTDSEALLTLILNNFSSNSEEKTLH